MRPGRSPLRSTPQQRFDTAQQLLRAGTWFRKKGESAKAADAAQKALVHLDAAARLFDPALHPGLAVRRLELIGTVAEQVIGDVALATQSYTAAVQRSAKDATFAQARLAALGISVPATTPAP